MTTTHAASPAAGSPANSTAGTLSTALKEALGAGIVALGMFFLIVGLETSQNIRNELILVERWRLLAVAVGIAVVGRFVCAACIWPWFERRRSERAHIAASEPSRWKRTLVLFAIVGLFLYPVLVISLTGIQGSLKWIDNFGIQILIYVMLAWGLNIVVGLAGLLDLGYVAFYAVGAYTYALLAKEFGLSFWLLFPMAGAMAAMWGMLLGFPVLRLRGDYLAIVTLAFGEIIRLVLINWREVTNGSAGISSIPKISFPFLSFDATSPLYVGHLLDLPPSGAYYKIFLYYLILTMALLTALVTGRLRRMPVGRAWEALREDEVACRALGINTTNTKLTAFATGAMFGGFAGSFFAARQGFISPESFVFLQSAIILAIVVLGGMGSLMGIAVAAVAMVGGIEILREMHFLKIALGPGFTPELYRMLIFGLAMVVIMVWKPRGIVGSREPTIFLRERKPISAAFTKEGSG